MKTITIQLHQTPVKVTTEDNNVFMAESTMTITGLYDISKDELDEVIETMKKGHEGLLKSINK